MKKDKIITVKKDIKYIKLPYYGYISQKIRNELDSILKKLYPQVVFKFIFTNHNNIGSLFRYKDLIPEALQSGVCYEFKCPSCEAGYVGITNRNLYTRVHEHLGKSCRTGISLSNPSYSSIREHALDKNHPFNFNNFKIIVKANSNLSLKIIESIFIKTIKPKLNNMETSINLYTI